MLKKQNQGFICENCGEKVESLTNGSFRNHCPHCLYSKHVDVVPGDRSNLCKGLMRPKGVKYHTKKGYQIIHQCVRCGEKKVNVVAENTVQSDSFELLLHLFNV